MKNIFSLNNVNLQFISPKKFSLCESLNNLKINSLGNTNIPSIKRSSYEGWPPPSRMIINERTQSSALKRNVFIFNHRDQNGSKRTPTLAICCGRYPAIFFNQHEFESLIRELPWIKGEMELFRRKL